MPSQVIDFIVKCLEKKGNVWLSAKSLLSHPWFSKIK